MYEVNNPWHQPKKEWVYAPTWRTMEHCPMNESSSIFPKSYILTDGVNVVKAYYSNFDWYWHDSFTHEVITLFPIYWIDLPSN